MALRCDRRDVGVPLHVHVWMIPKNQTDLSDQGTFFSLVMIYLMNLLLLSLMLLLASPQITFAGFASDLLINLGNFAQWLVDLFGRRSP
jgi:hypothetical protein